MNALKNELGQGARGVDEVSALDWPSFAFLYVAARLERAQWRGITERQGRLREVTEGAVGARDLKLPVGVSQAVNR